MGRPFTPILTFLCFLSVGASAQIWYTGKVRDLVSGQNIGSATIQLGENLTTTNPYGDFVLSDTCGSDYELPDFQIFNNCLIWSGAQTIKLVLLSLDGRVFLGQELSGENIQYLLPQLPVGLYLLRLESTRSFFNYKLLSDGYQTLIATRHDSHVPNKVCESVDTLRISKEGFLPREIIVPRHSSNLDIKLLSTSYENLDYFPELIDPVAYELISSDPARSNSGEVRSIKVIYNIKKDQIYYINGNKYTLHYTFADRVLGYDKGHYVFNLTQYTNNPNRDFYMVDVNYYISQDRYIIQFVAAVEMDCDQVRFMFEKIKATTFFGDKLFFFPVKPEWEACTAVKQISSEELYNGQNYQALNLTRNYGYLRKVPISQLENTYLGRHDIVLVDGIPNDVSVVAGIITTEFQTPLSHINVLSHSRNTPNMALRDGFTRLDSLDGLLIYLDVKADEFEIRKATLSEAQAHWAQVEPSNPIVLSKDLTVSGLITLETINYSWVNRVGGKAANFSEILKVRMEDGSKIPVPESAFAIPFYYYQSHLERNGIDTLISNMLVNDSFLGDPEFRKQKLKEVQDKIKDAPFDPELEQLIRTQINNFDEFEAIRFRSSTNAEDLEDFSGAGLYDSFSAKKNDPGKSIEEAVKKVWASLWNWRAHEERDYFKIDHSSCAMGVLVHRSFPNEDANGVLVTENLYNENPGFIINAQFEDYSIVFPEPGVIHDQIMLFLWSVVPGEDFMIEYLTYSNLHGYAGQNVLTKDEIEELGRYSAAIKRRFYYDLPHTCNCVFKDFGVDIEFKIDSQVSPRKLYIKQARLY